MKIRLTNKVGHSQNDLQLEELILLHSQLKQKAVQKVMTPRHSQKVRIEVLIEDRGGHSWTIVGIKPTKQWCIHKIESIPNNAAFTMIRAKMPSWPLFQQ
jgi:hypothetical protein